MTQSGTDLLVKIEDLSQYGANQVVIDQLITASAFKRLTQFARNFQRIKWHRLEFRIILQTPTTTGGGYATGILRDAGDMIPSTEDGYRRFIGNDQVTIAKMWENSTTTMPNRLDWLYTSEDGELRWFAPGKFVFMIDHPATQPASVSIYADWTVSFKDPTIEGVTETVDGIVSQTVSYIDSSTGITGAKVPVLVGVDEAGTHLPDLRRWTTATAETIGNFYRFYAPVSIEYNGSSGLVSSHSAAGFLVAVSTTDLPIARLVDAAGNNLPAIPDDDSVVGTTAFTNNTDFIPWNPNSSPTKNTYQRAPWSRYPGAPPTFFKHSSIESSKPSKMPQEPTLKDLIQSQTESITQLVTALSGLTLPAKPTGYPSNSLWAETSHLSQSSPL